MKPRAIPIHGRRNGQNKPAPINIPPTYQQKTNAAPGDGSRKTVGKRKIDEISAVPVATMAVAISKSLIENFGMPSSLPFPASESMI
jgi:hypothetical protein